MASSPNRQETWAPRRGKPLSRLSPTFEAAFPFGGIRIWGVPLISELCSLLSLPRIGLA